MDGLRLFFILIIWERIVQQKSQTCFLIVSALTGIAIRDVGLRVVDVESGVMCPRKRWTQVATTAHDIVQDAKTSR